MSDHDPVYSATTSQPGADTGLTTEVERVRTVLEGFAPDAAVRHALLEYLADLIQAADALGHDRWVVTVRDRLRLVVGQCIAFSLGPDGVWLALERSDLAPEALNRLEQLPDWMREAYKTIPSAVTATLPADQFIDLAPSVQPASISFVRTAGTMTRRAHPASRRAHNEAAIRYLSTTLNRTIPSPVIELPAYASMEQLQKIDRASVEAALERFDREERDSEKWLDWERDPTFHYAISWQDQRYPVKEIVRLASGETAFNTNMARRVLRQLGFIVEPLDKAERHVWLFQANPRFYNLVEHLKDVTPGDDDDWTVTRYRNDMDIGDRVLLWLSGPNAGVYALGELTGVPVERHHPADEVPAWIEAAPGEAKAEWRVPFRYTQILEEPIRRATLLEHPVLKQMHVIRSASGTNFRVTAEEWSALEDLLEQAPNPVPGVQPAYSLAECAADTGIEVSELRRWVSAIERKKQAVLYGPPGTGKTFVAQHLARHLVGAGTGNIDLVQFHPAYAYEDFVQGIRPRSEADGSLSYPLLPGRFLDFCSRAKGVDGRCVLIIDEINRANLSRVFGELMFLLEYRDHAIPLAAGGTFSIPANVRVIGTMNTADRSIALVDHALRRRFAFLALDPNYDVLRRFQERLDFDARGLVSVLQQVNAAIGDPHFAVGTSFFLVPDLPINLEDIWRMEIEPYLEEFFFDRPEELQQFRWETISGRVQP